MAFRKRRFFRRRINGKLSRKHYTWVTSLNTRCAVTTLAHCVPPGLEPPTFCCPSEVQLVLLDNAVIQSSFQDSIKVVRIHGALKFMWDFSIIRAGLAILFPTCESFASGLSNYYNTFAGKASSGIAIREIHNGDLTTLPRMNPEEDFDFSEGRWKQMRFHQQLPWANQNAFFNCERTIDDLNGVCSSVTGTSPGATTTICSAFPLPQATLGVGSNLGFPQNIPPWTWRFNNKLNLRVRENQLPVMSMGWSTVDNANGQLPAPPLLMCGAVKLLIEVG